MTYADLRTDFVFLKIFGQHEDVLRGLLNDLLEREGDEAITSLDYLPPGQAPVVPGAKLSILDVRCRTSNGEVFVVEMQVLPVTAFLNRVVFNACKAYVGTLPAARPYRELMDVVAVSICDFELWPDAEQRALGEPLVPMLSRWKMTEMRGAQRGLGQVQYVFLELPKLGDTLPADPVAWWASLFRVATELKREEVEASTEISKAQRRALELAELARWNERDIDAYIRAHEEVDQVLRMVETREAQGRAETEIAIMADVAALRLGHALTEAERSALSRWLQRDGRSAVTREVMQLAPDALALRLT